MKQQSYDRLDFQIWIFNYKFYHKYIIFLIYDF